MTARKPLVMVDGELTQLPDGDTLLAVLAAAGGTMVEATPLTLTSVGQTSVAVPGGYADHVVVLVRNGSVLDVGVDYTAVDGINVVLSDPVVSMDEALTAYKFSAFSVANTYTQTQINALLAPLQASLDALPAEVSRRLLLPVTNSTVTPAELLALDIPKAGVYELSATLRFRTAATTTGIGLLLSAGTGEVSAQLSVPIAAAGTASFYEGAVSASGALVLSTAVLAANTDYPVVLRGSYTAVGAGRLVLQMRSEIAASLVTVQANSYFRAREVK